MKIFKNKEIQKYLIILLIISFVFVVGTFIWNVYFGIFTLCLCSLFIFLFVLILNSKYKKIRELSDSLNKVLHGDYQLIINDYSEGEFGILQNEIYKITVKLREQHLELEKDKKYLADSIADISHQIRTPLTTINILLSLLSKPELPIEKKQNILSELYESLYRIEWLINSLLKMSKFDAQTIKFKKEEIKLEELIEKASSTLLVSMDLKNQKLTKNVSGNFNGDLLWTIEAIENIIKNCMEHTPENGEITINASENALYSEITISDSGSGINKEDLPHIFERFYKGQNDTSKGFGIGLALARSIIVSQNGTIKADNKPNGGAIFTIKFYKQVI